MAVRSAETARPVLAGFVPGVTVTVKRDVPPIPTELGLAAPIPEGFVGPSALTIEMSSMPTHSSLPTASVVIIRTWTSGWLSAAAGKVALTGVTSVARLGPVVASATKAGGHVREVAGGADAELQGDGLDGVVGRPVDVAEVVGDDDVARVRSCRRGSGCTAPGRARALQGDDGFAMWNSATPPVAKLLGLGRLAVTSTTGAPSPRTV